MKIDTQIQDLPKLLNELPKSPGIYKMINADGAVIYIGKAKELNKRVKQYFQKDYQHSTRTKKLLENIANIEVVAVDSELEATILEHNLIKQLQPKYNVIMKDDKNYVYIKITKEDFPRIQIVRRIEKDNAKYIGPKTAAHKVKETFKVLKKLFPFRHCGLDIDFINEELPNSEGVTEHKVKVTNKVLKYPCIDYYIKRCIAPCIGRCNISQYKEIIDNIEKFLSGKGEETLKNLYDQMMQYAQNKQFEKAGKLRDKIKKVEEILERQKVADHNQEDKDIINYCISQNKAFFNLFQIRDGKLIGQENFTLSAQDIEENTIHPEVIESFLKHYYEIATDIPKEILIPHEIENINEIQKLIEDYSQKRLKIIIPKIGTKNKLLEMSLNNARIFADRQRSSWQTESDYSLAAISELQTVLKLEKKPKRIECYDISHLSGTETVGSMVVFENGVPKKSDYRKFKIKTVNNKPDDYKSMEEVLYRRFSRLGAASKYKNYNFGKAKKKDLDLIKEQLKAEKITTKQSACALGPVSGTKTRTSVSTEKEFYLLEKENKTVGFIATQKRSEKVTELCNLFVNKDQRGNKLGYKLIKEAIKRSKAKRLYIICQEKLRDYYLLIGFEEIKQVPTELKTKFEKLQKEKSETICLAYDTRKHKEDSSFSKIPDLIIIDGGKGQLGVAEIILKKMELEIPHVSLAKRLEEIFIPKIEQPLILPSNSEALKLLQRARDEAHRFAISYNQNLRSKKLLK